MTEFSLFYNYRAVGDVLILVGASALTPQRWERHGNVVLIYNGNDLIGINVYETMDLLKIKAAGLLHALNKRMVTVIVDLIRVSTGLQISIADDSYVVGKVIRTSPVLTVDCGTGPLRAVAEKPVAPGTFVIVARPEERLSFGPLVKEITEPQTVWIVDEAYRAFENDIGRPVYALGR